MINDGIIEKIVSVIDQLDIKIPSTKELDPMQLVEIMKRDKKMRDGKIHLVLPKELGDVSVIPVTDEKVIRDSYAVLNK
jgi:3-dehydroquinate synthetase